MRWILLAVSLVLAAATAVAVLYSNTAPRWHERESAAFEDAQRSGRLVLIDFTADWCAPCKEVEDVLSAEPVRTRLAEHFVLLRQDVTEQSEQDEALQARYRVLSLPTVLFVDAEGRELGRYAHQKPSVDGFLEAIDALVQRVPIRVTQDGFEPKVVHLSQGVPTVLELTRTVERNCLKAVRMPWMTEATDLPLNERVEFPVQTRHSGTFTYTCWMNMAKGRVIIE